VQADEVDREAKNSRSSRSNGAPFHLQEFLKVRTSQVDVWMFMSGTAYTTACRAP